MSSINTERKNLSTVQVGPIKLKSPLLTCSGTSGSDHEIFEMHDFDNIKNSLGGFVTKGVTLNPRTGNPPPRIVEESHSMINAIGLQNKGAEFFVKNSLCTLKRIDLPVIVNISAHEISEFGELADYLSKNDSDKIIKGYEINVSCPNIKKGGKVFGTDPFLTGEIVKTVKKYCGGRALITKLTPNLDDITHPAKAAIDGGTDALSLINTLRAMAVDIKSKKPKLANITGGLSGPAIKPIGLFMVHQCFQNIKACREKKVPIIAMGGIQDASSALEYIITGASVVAAGSSFLNNHLVFKEIADGINEYLGDHNESLDGLIGSLIL